MAIKTTISKPKKDLKQAEDKEVRVPSESLLPKEAPQEQSVVRTKRPCIYCKEAKEPSFTDIIALRKFMSERARIIPKTRSGACSKHQRRITKQIKYARELAMLPFVNKI